MSPNARMSRTVCTMQAAWWVEYVCRHQGARWLRGVEEEMPYYQVRKGVKTFSVRWTDGRTNQQLDFYSCSGQLKMVLDKLAHLIC